MLTTNKGFYIKTLMNNNERNARAAKAAQFGHDAFVAGARRIIALDVEFVAFVQGLEADGLERSQALKLMEAWYGGWDVANLRAA